MRLVTFTLYLCRRSGAVVVIVGSEEDDDVKVARKEEEWKGKSDWPMLSRLERPRCAKQFPQRRKMQGLVRRQR